jgi:hypothetical protein
MKKPAAATVSAPAVKRKAAKTMKAAVSAGTPAESVSASAVVPADTPAAPAATYWRDLPPQYVDSEGEEYPFNLRNPRVWQEPGLGWVLSNASSDEESEMEWLNKKDME